MKKTKILLSLIILTLTSCVELDLSPLDEPSTGSWFTTQKQFEMSLNDRYRLDFWQGAMVDWTDDYNYRNINASIIDGTLTSQDANVASLWLLQYKAIARSNTIINSIGSGRENGISESLLTQYEAEAKFFRASAYAKLVFSFGDVPYCTEVVDLTTAYGMGRTDKNEVKKAIYDDYDFAIEHLPASYATKVTRATKGAALALKARYALYFGDFAIAAEAAKACMDLKVYSLSPSFGAYFLNKNDRESIFLIPRSYPDKISYYTKNYIPRNAGGYAAYDPSWALLASFECTDGLTIDKSPLFNPREPFKNRDPRCTATIVEFGSTHMGIVYNPHPDSLKVMNYNTGKKITNNDTRAQNQYAAYNGLVWKKGVDESWGSVNSFQAANDQVVIRYADVLLIYAEAKIELNQIDNSVLNAINMIRARAYGVNVNNTAGYPEITTLDQIQLRKVLRRERRVEFAWEGLPLHGLRYYDLIRWRIAGDAFNKPNPGMLYPASLLRSKVVNPGHWFWASAPSFDDNDIPDFSEMINNGYAQALSVGAWDDRQYLWPIPATEIEINGNMTQNPGY